MLATPEILAEAAQPYRVAAALPGLLERVPMYRNAVRTGASDSCRSLGLDHFPFITKADIRAGFPANFLPDGTKLQDLLDDEEVELEHTSGTSETRTALLLRRGWWAEQEARALRLNPFVSAILERDPNARRLNLS